jgi:uncharacterized membrane protein YoaT (DUF817 family)
LGDAALLAENIATFDSCWQAKGSRTQWRMIA